MTWSGALIDHAEHVMTITLPASFIVTMDQVNPAGLVEMTPPTDREARPLKIWPVRYCSKAGIAAHQASQPISARLRIACSASRSSLLTEARAHVSFLA